MYGTPACYAWFSPLAQPFKLGCFVSDNLESQVLQVTVNAEMRAYGEFLKLINAMLESVNVFDDDHLWGRTLIGFS
jgi:hypothetical protein